MRLGVLDVGSNTVHLLVVDAHHGARPLPAHSHKAELRLAQLLDADGAIGERGVTALTATLREALQAAEDKGVEELLPFATSAVRDAVNADEVLRRVREETGVRLDVLSGPEEARLTFLAARRWFGWSAGRLLLLDIGGGSLEIAYGLDEEPDAAVSLPLGAGRTHARLPGDPPAPEDVRELRKYVRATIARVVGEFSRFGPPDHVVATSKTFRRLARVGGAARSSEGLYVTRELKRRSLEEWVPRLAAMTAAERAELPGIPEDRADQLLAGAIVAEGAFDLFGIERAEVCPWALREGVILRRLDRLDRAEGGRGTVTETVATRAPRG
ncbi:Ppx/GppA phosphatase family protein [Streptomyces sp. SID11385]|uniref:Ppx/GppA phosphatase family protein n=1 Tax=Streptomyces sp. SID11385 TaxID=2706031 RepID=UPI0013CCBF7D|nr:Ppx/GppA phosphatase family protein [Streptomyces sp. SID11385]NEA44264.1 Ppx/GppA family phosphatase [Streptomyces sp. SID11385]